METGFDSLRRVHTQEPACAGEPWGGTEGMYPESDTLGEQPYPVRSAAGLVDYGVIDGIVDDLGCDASGIIAILQGIQETYRYIPPEVFPYLARRLEVSEARIYSVATFYENFSLNPKGEYVIKICDGTACHVRKSTPILARLREELELSEKKATTDDLGFTVETVSCLGACGLAPVITVNEQVYPAMTPEKAAALLGELRETRTKREAVHA